MRFYIHRVQRGFADFRITFYQIREMLAVDGVVKKGVIIFGKTFVSCKHLASLG